MIDEREEEPSIPYDDEGYSSDNQPIEVYMLDNKLCCTAMHSTPWGLVPLSIVAPIQGEKFQDGPVTIGEDSRLDTAINDVKKKMQVSSMKEEQRLAAESLVKRARCGDQNAMAIISLVAQNAPKSARAKSAYQYIRQYIDSHPLGAPRFAGESVSTGPSRPVHRIGVRLANSERLTNDRIGHMVNVFGGKRSKKRKLLTYGITKFGAESEIEELKKRLDSVEKALLDFGRAIGLARAIQLVRAPQTPIKVLSPKAAWELGER